MANLEIHTNGCGLVCSERVIGETKENARLSDPTVSAEENEKVRCRAGWMQESQRHSSFYVSFEDQALSSCDWVQGLRAGCGQAGAHPEFKSNPRKTKPAKQAC